MLSSALNERQPWRPYAWRSLAALARGAAVGLLAPAAGLLGATQPTSAADGRFVNLSTRALVKTGEEVMIGGFVIEDGHREVLIQAAGPELADRGIANALADPVLTVTKTTDPDNPIEVVVNDNWEDTQGQLVSDFWGGSSPLTVGSLSAAAVLTLEPGNYTAKVEGKDGATGVALVEVYGIDSFSADGRFVNLSTRASVEAGEEVMIGGFVIEDGYRQVLIQAKGPELVNDGIANALADPELTVIKTTDPANPINRAYNDNWEDSQGQWVTDLWGGSPPLTAGSLSAGAVLILEPGSYTALVEGKDGATGVAIVEVYGIDSDSPGAASPDLVALTALYNAANGVYWERSDNWGTLVPLDQWYGVKVDENSRVVELDLRSNRLRGTIPPVLSNLSNLQYLGLDDNLLSGPIPPELGRLENLEKLVLSQNQLSGSIPPVLSNLSNLQHLELADNQLSGLIPSELGQLANLKTLSLQVNELGGPLPAELGDLSNLEFFFYFSTDLCVPEEPLLEAWLGEILHHQGTEATCPPDIIEVHPGKVLRTYSRSPIGINLNYIRDHDDNRPDEAIPLAEALQTMGCHWLRYPGGEKSDWHFFKPTPYHVDSVIKSQPTGWYAILAHEHELLDFDDFMEVVRAYDAEPYVVVPSEPEHRSGVDANTYIEHAAAWVHYANRKKDYGVTYWEIGNENWNRDSHESVADYVARAVHIAKAMKAVDPDIRIGCSASNFGQFKAVLQHGEGFFDFLSLSNYVGSASTGWIGGFGHYRSLWPGALTKLPVQAVAAIRDVAPGAGMEIIISEFNAVDFEGIWPNRNDLGHALVAFDMLGESLRVPHLSAVILWTTRWMEDQRHNDEMWYALDAENRPTAAIGYAMSIWGRYFKPAVVAVETPVASLSAHAVADPNSGALTVFIINKSNDTAEIPLRIAGTTNYDKAKLVFPRFCGHEQRSVCSC